MQRRIMALVVGIVVCATAGAARAATEPQPARFVTPNDGRSLGVVQPAPRGFGRVQPNPRTWSVIVPNPRMFSRDEPNPRLWGKVQPKPRFWSVRGQRLATRSTVGAAAASNAVGRWSGVRPNTRVAGAIGRWGGVVPNPRQWRAVQRNPARFR